MCAAILLLGKKGHNSGKKPGMGVFISSSDAVRVEIYTEGAILGYVYSSLQYIQCSGKGDKWASAEQNSFDLFRVSTSV